MNIEQGSFYTINNLWDVYGVAISYPHYHDGMLEGEMPKSYTGILKLGTTLYVVEKVSLLKHKFSKEFVASQKKFEKNSNKDFVISTGLATGASAGFMMIDLLIGLIFNITLVAINVTTFLLSRKSQKSLIKLMNQRETGWVCMTSDCELILVMDNDKYFKKYFRKVEGDETEKSGVSS